MIIRQLALFDEIADRAAAAAAGVDDVGRRLAGLERGDDERLDEAVLKDVGRDRIEADLAVGLSDIEI